MVDGRLFRKHSDHVLVFWRSKMKGVFAYNVHLFTVGSDLEGAHGVLLELITLFVLAASRTPHNG